MLRRTFSFYLWIAPLAMAPLWFIYHRNGLTAGIAAGALHLLLTLAGMSASGMLAGKALASSYGLSRALLTLGGSLVWMVGAAGPPHRRDGLMAFYNNVGLMTGIFVLLLGVTALKKELEKENGALAAIGHTCFSTSFGIWVIESFLIWVMLTAPAAGLPDAAKPDWLSAILPVWNGIDSLRLATVYLGSAAVAGSLVAARRIHRGVGWTMIAFSLAGVVFGLRQDMPFFIPAVTCLVPYFIGLTAKRAVV
jgi:hypothetical protein